MSGTFTIILIALVFVIIYQIAKASEYSTILRGEEKINKRVNRAIALLFLLFFISGMIGIYICHEALKGRILPVSASDHGVQYDMMFTATIVVTGIVFFITQALLFWFAYKYQASEKRTAFFFPHNNKLELVWTTVPAIAMACLVAIGLRNWMNMTATAPKDAMIVEVVGKQFNWLIRYPGKDGVLGKRDFRKINDANNILGLDWNDKDNADDVIAQNGELHLVVNKPVSLIIGSRDVIHDVGLSHFRMKMDAVPGIVTTIWFTPTITTDKMKEITGNKDFVYEISCDQMCGKGHYSMRGTVIVETQEEYDAWMAKQQSYYALNNAPATPAADSTAKPADSMKAITMK